MLKSYSVSLFAFLTLVACSATQPEPYEAHKSPENRREYNGLKGLVQKQKDQNFLQAAELSRQCDEARVDLAVAQVSGDKIAEKAQERIIDKTCL